MTYANSTIAEHVVGFDFQKEWIERRGLFLLIAFYLGGVGGGLFITSLIIGWEIGMLIALGIVGIGKGSAHLLFLGRPLRFWRAPMRPQSSWISRGFIFMFLFLILGLITFVTYDDEVSVIGIFACVFAFALMAYTGFAMASCPGIPFWSNPLLPMIFAGAAWWSGTSIADVVHALRDETDIINAHRLEDLGIWLGTVSAASLFCYLLVSYSSGIAARKSVAFLTRGNFSPAFYLGIVVLGLIIPLAILVPVYTGDIDAGSGWLAVAGFSELIGSFVLRYSMLKAGVYPPVTA